MSTLWCSDGFRIIVLVGCARTRNTELSSLSAERHAVVLALLQWDVFLGGNGMIFDDQPCMMTEQQAAWALVGALMDKSLSDEDRGKLYDWWNTDHRGR